MALSLCGSIGIWIFWIYLFTIIFLNGGVILVECQPIALLEIIMCFGMVIASAYMLYKFDSKLKTEAETENAKL